MNECAYHCSFLGSAHHLHLLCWVRNILSPSPETRTLPKTESSLLPTLGFWWRCHLLWNFLSSRARSSHGLFFSISDQEPATAPHTHITLLSNIFLQPFSFTVFSSPHFLIISPSLKPAALRNTYPRVLVPTSYIPGWTKWTVVNLPISARVSS